MAMAWLCYLLTIGWRATFGGEGRGVIAIVFVSASSGCAGICGRVFLILATGIVRHCRRRLAARTACATPRSRLFPRRRAPSRVSFPPPSPPLHSTPPPPPALPSSSLRRHSRRTRS
ncbi:hypothetical protein BD414DRAFT_490347 [Trametes punicea]|nr:hypothetical protein BD414DRAFT_490347 [Trametes punicea]